MEIIIFKELTTNDYLDQLQVESEKYTGLYVDMNNAPERKYVKEKAQTINDLLKKIDRARIDESKAYKLKAEKEAADIKERLEIANLPFTLLIDAYTAERKKILDEEKVRKQAVIDAEHYEIDHEFALMINKTFAFDREQELKRGQELEAVRQKEMENYAAEKVSIAEERQKQSIIDGLQREKDAETARLASVEYVRKINTNILLVLVNNGISEEDAKTMVRLAAKRELPNVTINY